ncbi:hypothetical protein SEA_PGHHAMLIN_2 [Mycobacterium phage PGHhamlin]|nr:hypothetical protein PBI_MALINSILVA_2 [Mycobacterium phage Malinsilva]AWD93360.1 hypothetical protein SEA_PGHHAMLIN_2 [Mycobacterium phage PGHhamlin]AXH49063.1 hypothetical protein SEA_AUGSMAGNUMOPUS_2 [Mycobacterium phage AugsMagnumOpus]AYB69924.1 hypothetical protein SEA_MUCHMORE_2 [Mycobacterium phage MuchMore]
MWLLSHSRGPATLDPKVSPTIGCRGKREGNLRRGERWGLALARPSEEPPPSGSPPGAPGALPLQ